MRMISFIKFYCCYFSQGSKCTWLFLIELLKIWSVFSVDILFVISVVEDRTFAVVDTFCSWFYWGAHWFDTAVVSLFYNLFEKRVVFSGIILFFTTWFSWMDFFYYFSKRFLSFQITESLRLWIYRRILRLWLNNEILFNKVFICLSRQFNIFISFHRNHSFESNHLWLPIKLSKIWMLKSLSCWPSFLRIKF